MNDDLISRQAVIDGLASIAKAKAKSDAQKSLIGRVMFFTEHLPSVRPQELTREEQALLQKWRDNRGISMEEFAEAMNALQEPQEGSANNG